MNKLIVEKIQRIQVIHFNNPENLNALSTGLLAEISRQLQVAEQDNGIDCVVLYGGTKAFSCGSDIKELEKKSPLEVFYDERTGYWNQIFQFKKPLIAAVNRFVLGSGFELALMCDIVVASDDAVFGNPEIDLGLLPGAGATVLLPKLIGKNRAFEMIVTGEQINAAKALEIGLINHVVAPDKTIAKGVEIAQLISSKSRTSTMFIKECLRNSSGDNLESARKMERMLFSLIFSSKNSQKGIEAYLGKTKPVFDNN